jgi:hypothetical protein
MSLTGFISRLIYGQRKQTLTNYCVFFVATDVTPAIVGDGVEDHGQYTPIPQPPAIRELIHDNQSLPV